MTPPSGIEGTRPAEAVLSDPSGSGEAARWEADLAFADAFIARFGWCDGIRERHIGLAAGPVSAVLYRIAPAGEAGEWHWLVTGDAPPLVIEAAGPTSPASALAAYCRELDRWSTAVRAGAPLDGVPPLLTADGLGLLEPTPEAADLIEERVGEIRDEALSDGRGGS